MKKTTVTFLVKVTLMKMISMDFNNFDRRTKELCCEAFVDQKIDDRMYNSFNYCRFSESSKHITTCSQFWRMCLAVLCLILLVFVYKVPNLVLKKKIIVFKYSVHKNINVSEKKFHFIV